MSQTGDTKPADLDRDIQERERLRREALMAGDLDAIRALLDDGLYYVHASARKDDKASFMAALPGARYVRIDIENEQVSTFGNTAVVTFEEEVDLQRNGAQRTFHSYALDIWAKGEDGSWRMAFRQVTAKPS